jgi:hypothetical protein
VKSAKIQILGTFFFSLIVVHFSLPAGTFHF